MYHFLCQIALSYILTIILRLFLVVCETRKIIQFFWWHQAHKYHDIDCIHSPITLIKTGIGNHSGENFFISIKTYLDQKIKHSM